MLIPQSPLESPHGFSPPSFSIGHEAAEAVYGSSIRDQFELIYILWWCGCWRDFYASERRRGESVDLGGEA